MGRVGTSRSRGSGSELHDFERNLHPLQGSGWAGLSSRERDVALLVAKGFGNQGIAAELHVSEHTVRTHVSRILAAFGVTSRAAVAAQLAGILATQLGGEQPAPLTRRQHAVVDCIVRGQTNEQIGRELEISVKTVEKHVTEILRRWNVDSRSGIARRAHARTDSTS